MSHTISKDLTDKLRQHIGQGNGVVSSDTDAASISVDIEQSERYAVGVRGIDVRPKQPIGDVGEAAERIVSNVDALGEPLQVVECDPKAGQAIVRSAQPETDEAGVTYWEADVQRDQTSLHRYRKEHSAPDREAVTEPLPHAVAGKIAEQLADAVRP